MKIWPDPVADKKGMAYSGSKVADARKGAWTATTGVGTYYGRAMKNPVGRMRDSSVGMRPVSRKQLGTKPRSVV